jgi:hypothetical protein
MRTHENDVRVTMAALLNAGGSAPGIIWLVAANGTYDVRLTEPRAKLLAVSVSPNAGATQFQLNYFQPGVTPPGTQVQFLSAGGAAGAYGGNVLVHWKRGSA